MIFKRITEEKIDEKAQDYFWEKTKYIFGMPFARWTYTKKGVNTSEKLGFKK